jgi:hypothetical protein
MERTLRLQPWTVALAAAGVISLPCLTPAEEKLSAVQTALSSTVFSGYVDTSAIWKVGKGNGGNGVGNPAPGDTFPGRSFDGTGKQDGFNLNVVALTLKKAPEQGGWSAGYNFTMLFGPDAVNYNTSANAPALADFALKDAYVELQVPVGKGLDLKLGNFTGIIGYEVFESGNNPNYSRSYGYFIEPVQLTGLLASLPVNDVLTLSAGVANTWGTGLNARPTRAGLPASESEKTYLGSATLTAPKSMGWLSGGTLCFAVADGLGTGPVSPASDTTSVYVGGTIPTPLKGLSVGGAWEYRGTKQVGAVPSTYANATSLYLLFQATEKLKLASRVEYATGSAATWYTVSAAMLHPRNQVLGWTLTADYSIWANVISRLEFRWDHDLTGDGPFGLNENNAFSLALNLIYKF